MTKKRFGRTSRAPMALRLLSHGHKVSLAIRELFTIGALEPAPALRSTPKEQIKAQAQLAL